MKVGTNLRRWYLNLEWGLREPSYNSVIGIVVMNKIRVPVRHCIHNRVFKPLRVQVRLKCE